MAWIRAGVVALTNGSKAVVGTGTAWSGNVMEGDQFNTPAGPYEVESIANDGSLQLATAYAGPTASNLTYSIVPTQGRIVPVAKQLSTLLSTVGQMKDAYEAGNLAEVGDLLGKVDATQLAKATGAFNVGYQRDSAAILRGVGDQLDQFLTVYEYMSDEQVSQAKSRMPQLDFTDALQKTIDRNKGHRIIVPAGGVFQIAGVFMEGQTYSSTKLDCQGRLLLGKRPTTTSSIFQGAWVGLMLRDCDDIEVNLYADGQRAIQPNEEHVYIMGLAGVRGLTIPRARMLNMRGDGIYCSQYNWSTTSANTDGVTIGILEAYNAAPDGRNAFSLISGDNIAIETFKSFNVGAIVGGYTQPGGFDIEPNHVGQSCKNISIGSLQVVTAGTSGLAIAGRPGRDDITANVSIGTAVVVNTCLPTLAAANGSLSQTNNHTLIVTSATDVTIENYKGSFTAAYGDAVIIGDARGVKLKGSVRHVREGARIGGDTLDATGGGAGVRESKIDLAVSDWCRFGIRTGKVSTSSKITGNVTSVTPGFYTGGIHAVVTMSFPGVPLTQKDVEYSVSAEASPHIARSYRNDVSYPVTYDNVVIRDCDCSGTTWAAQVNQFGDMKVPRYNVRGVTDRPSAPSGLASSCVPGQQFTNSAATTAGAPTGWVFTGSEVRATGVVA